MYRLNKIAIYASLRSVYQQICLQLFCLSFYLCCVGYASIAYLLPKPSQSPCHLFVRTIRTIRSIRTISPQQFLK